MASETSSSEISSSQATQISNSTSSANPSQLPSLITVIPIVNPQLSIKLDDDNFLLWKNQMLNSIIAHGFDDFIDRFRPCPPRFLANQPGEVNPDYTVWQRTSIPSKFCSRAILIKVSIKPLQIPPSLMQWLPLQSVFSLIPPILPSSPAYGTTA
ncbi:uncharacterized protein LOC21412525 isoform X2 [Morus notabilis]|uniref:uncharacterized protein LOC21412525 isoform X2 n=1 Tax=Morus notabilis TaxID=981085 RepID=UPI000CECFFE4|nr:uncharacterized protein LOC21412525 isoform X2 [Morus notabilis]